MAEFDILNIQPNKVNASLSGKTLMVYGKNKVGKTTWCAKELPKPLLCAFEKGYNAIPGVMILLILWQLCVSLMFVNKLEYQH